jgi:hypothetical protein
MSCFDNFLLALISKSLGFMPNSLISLVSLLIQSHHFFGVEIGFLFFKTALELFYAIFVAFYKGIEGKIGLVFLENF